MMDQISQFITAAGKVTNCPSNRWFKSRNLEIYLRRTIRFFNGVSTECIDIANVNAVPKGKGSFTECLTGIEKIAENNGFTIYVENVLNDRLQSFLSRRGYSIKEGSNPVSLYRKFGK